MRTRAYNSLAYPALIAMIDTMCISWRGKTGDSWCHLRMICIQRETQRSISPTTAFYSMDGVLSNGPVFGAANICVKGTNTTHRNRTLRRNYVETLSVVECQDYGATGEEFTSIQ